MRIMKTVLINLFYFILSILVKGFQTSFSPKTSTLFQDVRE